MIARTLMAIALALAVPACCCKGSVEDRVRNAQGENSRLKFELDATEKANAGMRDYAAELAGGGSGKPTYSIYYSAQELTAFSGKITPYRMDAKSFHNQLQGQIVVDRVYDFVFLSGNRLKCKLDMRGLNLKFTGQVPDIAKGQVAAFIRDVEGGVIVDLDVSLSWQGSQVKALAQATNTKMKKTGKSESRLQDEMNKRALKDPLNIDVRVNGYEARLQRVLVTGNHVVLSYLAL